MFQVCESGNRVTVVLDGVAVVTAVKDKVAFLPDTVSTVGEALFENDTEMEGIVLPDSIERIMPMAFMDCKNLKFAVLGKSLLSVEPGAFVGDKKCNWVFFNGTQKEFDNVFLSEPFESADAVYCRDGVWRPRKRK